MLSNLTSLMRLSRADALRESAFRFGTALMLAVLIQATACAYTVVMRSGRRIEVPNSFIVTTRTLTYEAAPGVNITLMMTGIDIPATERANNEAAGSLLQRAQETASPVAANTGATETPQARRTLTNKDLEASRRARQQSELAYERRRAELGLPSLEEVRRRNALEAERTREQLQQSEREGEQVEGYWRGRASALRAEIAALDGEINYLRVRLAEEPERISTPFTSVTTLIPSFPYGYGGTRFSLPVLTGNPGFIHATNTGLQVAGRIGFGGGSTRSQVLLHAGSGVPLVAPPVIVGGSVFGSPLATYSTGPFPNNYYPTYERSALIIRLHEVEAARAGLQSRTRLLEDEARRAGALPGWLRP